jgi:aryl-alcohol dehydrogenase-like predicted oxidoreductase
MSRLAIGTVQFGLPYGVANQVGQVSRAEAKAMLQVALDNGIDTLDTAIAYGDSEACLGKVGTSGFKLITKLPALPDSSVDINTWVQQELNASLLRMGVTRVYGLLLHRSEQLLGSQGVLLYKALQSLKDNGQVQKIGVSIYSPNELVVLTPQYHFDLVQAPFSLVDRRLYSTSWMQRLKDADVEIHTRSVFLQGLLLMSKADMPIKFSPWADLWQTWHRWLADHDCSAVEACLAFPLSFPEIDRVVVGTDSVSQLAQIVSAVKQVKINLPNLQSEDENLINPGNWNLL